MIVGWVDVVLLAADIATGAADDMLVDFELLDYNYFQKLYIAVNLFFALLWHPQFLWF